MFGQNSIACCTLGSSDMPMEWYLAGEDLYTKKCLCIPKWEELIGKAQEKGMLGMDPERDPAVVPQVPSTHWHPSSFPKEDLSI
jgi:hypothetical protein